MYVNPFWFGVLVTLMVEIVCIIGYAAVISNRGKKK
jgi:hypothetical protein